QLQIGEVQPLSGLGLNWLLMMLPILSIPIVFSVMSLYGFVEQSVKNYGSLVEIEVKANGESSIAVRTLKGILVSKGWVKLVQFEYHRQTGHSYDDLRKLGNGKHTIQRK